MPYGEIAKLALEYVEDLLTASPREEWSKVDVLVLLNLVKNDPAMNKFLNMYGSAIEV